MKQVSDRTLMVLAIMAVSISLVGVFFNIQKEQNLLSGAATGSVNVSINETVSINLLRDSINFTASVPTENKDSGESDNVKPCTGDNACGFMIANNGSSIANVSLQTTEDLFDSSSTNANTFKAKVNSAAAYTGYDKGTGCTGASTVAYTDVRNSAGVKARFISCLNYSVSSLGANIAFVDINITVPSDESSGTKTSTVTFTGSIA